jgi:hypothetical protein
VADEQQRNSLMLFCEHAKAPWQTSDGLQLLLAACNQ